MRNKFDIAILGSGFAGTLLANILARQGCSVAVIDGRSHPRFAIGESSTPLADCSLRRITRRYQLDELSSLASFGPWTRDYPDVLCGCKRGFSYLYHGNETGFRATQDRANECLVAASSSRETSDTQWYRPDVDALFARAAAVAGVQFYEDSIVSEIAHPAEHDWLVDFTRDGHRVSLGARFLVDASGPQGLLLRYLGIPDHPRSLKTQTSAIYSHWTGVTRTHGWLETQGVRTDDYPYPCDDAAVHHVFREGWLWKLRFENSHHGHDLASVGFVFNLKQGGQVPAIRDPSSGWRALMTQHPSMQDLLGDARLADVPGRVFATSRLQRLMSCGAGTDWAALPYTIGFVDPLHSTGIAHSLSGVERLSEIYLHSRSLDDRGQRLHTYSNAVINELRHIDRMVSACYDSLGDFRLFLAWTMVYFAAATTNEQQWAESPDQPHGFLCADDGAFVNIVEELSQETFRVRQSGMTDEKIFRLVAQIRQSVEPYNHVGLFRPEKPNLYSRTSAG